jgi:hypothetical protein
LFNITSNGLTKAGTKEKNIFRNIFELIDGINRMNKIFDYLHIQQNQTDQEKRIVHFISISICELVRNNGEGVNILLKTQIIGCLLWTLESAISIAFTPSCTDDVVNILN